MPSKERSHVRDREHPKRPSKPSLPHSAAPILPMHPAAIIQRATADPRSLTPDDARQLQRTIGNQAVGQLLSQATRPQPAQRKKNHTGLPDNLKAGIEYLSGMAMDDVKVHRNSTKPAAVNAAAYAQGHEIHLAPGQEKHLPHEAWHVVQQQQGRVKPTLQMKDVAVNDDVRLEQEADVMGRQSLALGEKASTGQDDTPAGQTMKSERPVYQRISAGTVLQLIYLWNRENEKKPHWSEKSQPPSGYLASGQYNDNEHGQDALYARMGSADLFYGISYEEDSRMEEFLEKLGEIAEEESIDIETPEGLTEVIVKYEESFGPPILDVVLYNAIYGGSSGWDRYTAFLESGKETGWAKSVQGLNPDLPWAVDKAGLACQTAMIAALMRGGSVRFLLDGMNNVKGIMEGTAYQGKVTSGELRFIVAMLNQTIDLGEDGEVTPTDGLNIFFYLNHQLIPADQLHQIGKEKTVEKVV